MPAQWTGRIVGEIHNHNLTAKELAREVGWQKFLNSGPWPSYRVADAYVNIAPEDLRIMLDTIIDNARRHGFSDDESYKNIFIQLLETDTTIITFPHIFITIFVNECRRVAETGEVRKF